MHTKLMNRSGEQVVAGIQALDLDPIKLKLMDAEEGQGWSREYVDRVELLYKRFLALLVTHPEETIAPSKDVDKFWHGHILDTLKYADDCQNVFGYFLHHFPYFGMRGAEDRANLKVASENMKRLYEREFGEPKHGDEAWCAAAINAKDAAWCAAAAQPEGVAWCAAAVKAQDAAWCAAAAQPEGAAWCAAAARADDPSWCAAAGEPEGAAWRAAARPAVNKLSLSVRPKLAKAASI